MADELKIPVSIPGAQQAAKDLRDVAAAEKAVGAANAEAAGGHQEAAAAGKANSEVTDELRIRNKSLAREVAALSPELAVLVETFVELKDKQTAAGMAMVGISAAIGVAVIAYSKLQAHQQEEKRRLAETVQLLEREYDAYLKIAEARRGAGPGGGSRADTQAAAEAALKYQLDPKTVEDLVRVRARGGDLDQAAQGMQRQYGARGDEDLARRYRADIEEILAGTRGPAGLAGALQDVARNEAARLDQPRTSENIQEYIRHLMLRASLVSTGHEEYDALNPRKAADRLREFVRQYPGLGDLQFDPMLQRPGTTGPTVNQVINNYYGVQNYGQYLDPAGQMTRSQAP